MQVSSQDILLLRRCVRDLVALTTLPALWRGYTPQGIAESLSDVLLSLLHAKIVYISIKSTEKPLKVARTSEQLYVGEQATVIAEKLDVQQDYKTIAALRSIVSPFGGDIWHSMSVPIEDADTIGFIFVGALQPFTETDDLLLGVAANQAAIALEQAQLLVDLKRANEQKDEFLSVAAHELRTPITSLRGFVQLLLRQINKRGEINPAHLPQALRTLDEQAAKLTYLISQLLDLSRIQAGRLTLEPKRTDIVLLVTRIVDTMQKNTKKHILSVKTIPTVESIVDPLRLEQVLINLLDNAIKYSPDGGTITINLDVMENQKLRIAVTDRGLGIAVERRQRIFERFYQAHADGYRGGMGLGLYISRQIVELHQGTIHVEFPDEGGTRFVVTLPLQSEAKLSEHVN